MQTEFTAPMRAMPAFISHKLVWALCIASIEPLADGGARLSFKDEGYAPITVDAAWVASRKPQAGGYFVTYQGDGYTSWSPADVFERGYTPAAQYGLPYQQETKYTTGPAGRIVNRETRKPVPDDEPIFVLRGKDRHAVDTLMAYRAMCVGDRHRANVAGRIEAFQQFAEAHAERMGEPTSN